MAHQSATASAVVPSVKHGESLPLADHADVLFVVWDPVFAVRGFLWRGERGGQRPDLLPTGTSLTRGCLHRCASC